MGGIQREVRKQVFDTNIDTHTNEKEKETKDVQLIRREHEKI